MNFFLSYLNSRKLCIGLFTLFALIFAAVLALYQVPLVTIVYPLGLCALAGLIGLILDFCRARRVHRTLSVIRTAADAAMLPETNDIPDRDYQQIIRRLCREQTALCNTMNEKYQNMMDYYTVWAHQIKTPIASMHLHLQNEDTGLARQLSSDLTRIEQYVEMVLMFLRLDSDSSDYVIRPCDLDSIVRKSVRKFAGEFIARKLKLIYEPLNEQVITDEKWLSFVVEQVLSNALKYTPGGSIQIYLEEPKTLCIRDTGIGIAAEDMPRIFEKGFTGCNGRSDQKASGIGLYLCRRICRNLGHSIGAESVPGRGTTIRIGLARYDLKAE